MNLKDDLVESAFDFLNRSIDVLEDHPKYSIIFFSTSLELFIKAKLADEHWTLVLEEPKAANIDKLKSGKFTSVSLSVGIDRIKNVLNESFSERQSNLFETIANHRNQIIHFYHKEFSKDPNNKMIEKALRDLSEGWYYLSNMLNSQSWENVASDYSTEIQSITQKLRDKGHLLQGKFHSLTEVIRRQENKGKEVYSCKVCSYDSAISNVIVENLIKCSCLVCESRYKTILIECPNCKEQVFTEEFGIAECTNCGFLTEFDETIDIFSPKSMRHDAYLDTPAFCSICEYFDASVVPIGEKYVCINCFSDFVEIDQCDFCSSYCSGYLEDSYLTGCVVCDGKFAQLQDD